MSVEAMAQVWKLDLPREKKLVLLALADHANDSGHAWPSMARVAWKCGYAKRRSIALIIRKLIDDDGVLEVLEKAHGRTPTLYRIRWDRGNLLPEFDPLTFGKDGDKGSENDPQAEQADSTKSDGAKPLTEQGENDRRGSKKDPQEDEGRKTTPKDSVEGRFDERRGSVSERRGSVASDPESLTINQRRAGARASESRAPASSESRDLDFEIRKLNGLAKRIGVELKTPNERLEHARERIESAHTRWLADQADARAGRGREAAASAQS